jgi:ABC-type glycerol-3-phosphate transport system substrate-binding protein
MRQRFLRLAAFMSVAVLVLAACGSDDGGETPPAASDTGAAEPVDISGTTLTVSNGTSPKSV